MMLKASLIINKGVIVLKEKLEELKDAVREWVSTLSIEEIIVNRELASIFKSIEMRIQIIENGHV